METQHLPLAHPEGKGDLRSMSSHVENSRCTHNRRAFMRGSEPAVNQASAEMAVPRGLCGYACSEQPWVVFALCESW